MHVAVLGCGPSGLLAAHAARQAGATVCVFSRQEKSKIYGAQFLHAAIPGVPLPDPVFVKWNHERNDAGDYVPEDYLRKVYGAAWDGRVNSEMFNSGQPGWDLRAAYEWLWEENEGRGGVIHYEYAAPTLAGIIGGHEMVFNTLPRETLCLEPQKHAFVSTKIWAIGDNHLHTAPYRPPLNTIIYNGNPTPAWYRASNIYGHCTMEWPGSGPRPPVQGVVPVAKPVSTTCTCWPNVRHVGRYGAWKSGFLLHHVYDEVKKALTAPKQGVLF